MTDIGLPGVSGLEMLDQAARKGLFVGSEIVVVCSASYELHEAALLRGALDPKPVDLEKIIELGNTSLVSSGETREVAGRLEYVFPPLTATSAAMVVSVGVREIVAA